jgi:hypothetical protein
MPTHHHVKTLAAASSSRPNSEVLATREVLAHPHVTFHPCTCRLHGGDVAVAATQFGYDDVEVAARTTTRRRWSWSTTFSTPTRDYVGSLLQLLFHCSTHLVVMIHDFLVASILGWHGSSSASVAYTFPYRRILHKKTPQLRSMNDIVHIW